MHSEISQEKCVLPLSQCKRCVVLGALCYVEQSNVVKWASHIDKQAVDKFWGKLPTKYVIGGGKQGA